MDYFHHQLDIGELQGIKINEEIMVWHRLFAGDLGIFILAIERKFQEIISIYEKTFGAMMNLAKIIIISLGLTYVP